MSDDTPSEGIGTKAARGVLWTGGGQVLRQVVQVIGNVALARLLVPDDFGLLGMALFFVGIGQLFADFGIGSAIVQARSDDRVVLSSCFWLNLAVAGVLSLAVLAAAPTIAAFYKRSDLAPVVAVLAFNLLLAGLQVVPQALLYRDMRFADLAKAQVLGSLAGAAVAIALAWMGVGVWALVAQPLVGSSVGLTVCLVALRWRPHLEYSWPKVAPLARFSANLLGANLVSYANRNVDSLLVGRFIGAGPLGLYSMAIQLMLYPLQQVSSVIVRVLFPALVHIKDDVPRLRQAYLKAVGAIALITFPMMGGLFAVADDFVAVVFGPAWSDMVPVLKVVAWVGMMQSVGTTVGTIYLAMGRPEVAFKVTVLGAPVLIAGMAAGLAWGIVGVAIGYAASNFLLFYFALVNALRLVGMRIASFHAALARPFATSLVMMLVVVGAHAAAVDVVPQVRLPALVALGIAAYMVLAIAFNRSQVREIWLTISSLRSRGTTQ